MFARWAHRPLWLRDHGAPGERAAALAAAWCTRRLGRAYAESAWQTLADAARLGVVRHRRPEVWGDRRGDRPRSRRRSDRRGASARRQEVANELEVSLGALTVTERELARVLNLARFAHRLPAAGGRTG
jgi:hypothetical protein